MNVALGLSIGLQGVIVWVLVSLKEAVEIISNNAMVSGER